MDPKCPITDPLLHTIEECSELIQALCKARRFGWEHYKPGNTQSNRLLVIMEMRDVEDSLAELKKYMENQK